jgi:hypothetical protein
MFGIDDAAAISGGVGLLNFIGGQTTNQANADIAAQNNQWSAQQYATRYQTQVKDLQAAGLNPALAYGASPGTAPTAQQVQFQNPVASATQAATDTASTIGRVQHDYSSANKANTEVRLINANADKVIEETKNVPFQGSQIKYTIQLLAEQAALAAQKGETEVSIRKQIAATVSKIKSETKLVDLDVDAAQSLDNIGRESRQLKPIVDIVRSIFGR